MKQGIFITTSANSHSTIFWKWDKVGPKNINKKVIGNYFVQLTILAKSNLLKSLSHI